MLTVVKRILLVLALVSTVLVLGCEGRRLMRGVTFENASGRQVVLYNKLLEPGYETSFIKSELLRPLEVKRALVMVAYPQVFQARDEQGRVIFEVRTSYDELEKMGWRIVITDQTLTPTPEARPP
jgi:hypothetical protein